MYHIRSSSNFILLHADIQFFQPHLSKRLFFPYSVLLTFLLKIGDHVSVELFLGYFLCFIGVLVYMPVLLPVHTFI